MKNEADKLAARLLEAHRETEQARSDHLAAAARRREAILEANGTLSQTEIAKLLGVSKQRIQQIIERG